MIGLISKTQDPAYNLATEELLLKHKSEDYLFLYVDSPSIIVGKHQNTYSEINFSNVHNSKIPVFRRLSGGGTVYHDKGNLNFCFITSGKPGKLIDFEGFTKHVIAALKNMNVNAYFGGRNDLLINGKKISGNASHVFKNRVMHHGTLLFSSDLTLLGNTLKTDPTKYQDKAVKSVRSVVTNISDYTNSDLSFNQFKSEVFHQIISNDVNEYELNKNDIESIQSLIETKYSLWEWNYGYSPDYTFSKRFKIDRLILNIAFKVHKGVISEVKINASQSADLVKKIFLKLENEQHEYKSILNRLGDDLNSHFNVNPDEIIIQLF